MFSIPIKEKTIEMLIDKKQFIGLLEAKWNADTFPSGLYFYRLTNERNSLTKKMMLVR
jgi:hypothetical protein